MKKVRGKHTNKKIKWYNIILYILLGIPVVLLAIILGILLLPLILLVIIALKISESKQHKKQREQLRHRRLDPSRMKVFKYCYHETNTRFPDEVFLERFDEVICIQYLSVNGLSGGKCLRELSFFDMPEKKEEVMAFFQEHPIEKLLNADLHCKNARDLNDWYIRFIFPNPDLNRQIKGYGYTELTEPYLFTLVRMLPEIMSKDERIEWAANNLMYKIEAVRSEPKDGSQQEHVEESADEN